MKVARLLNTSHNHHHTSLQVGVVKALHGHTHVLLRILLPLPALLFLFSLSVRVLAAGSTLGDPRGENTLLSPGSQGDCWMIPVYDFAAAAAAAGWGRGRWGWADSLSSWTRRKKMRDVKRKTSFFCSNATSSRFLEQFNKPQSFFF